MAIQDFSRYLISPFWNTDSYRNLAYAREDFNDPDQVSLWLSQGYIDRFEGDMCDMRQSQPDWNQRIIDRFVAQGWQDIGTSYYRMKTGTVLPVHSDRYVRYVNLFNLQGQEHRIRRAIIFLEDWSSGHYSEVAGQAIVGWRAGTTIEWAYDVPHMAANIGLRPRYTLQITGHV
jgi:hypothetical protein